MALERKSKRPAMTDPVAAPDAEGGPDGTIRISEQVICAIVRKYSLEVPGVVRFASNSLVGGLAEMIGRKSSDTNIVVDWSGDSVNVSVNLVLAFGSNVPEVAATVQDVIRTRVQEMTGKTVLKINVTVQDLEEAPKTVAPPTPALPGLG